ncbi:MAG: hypothetical protein QNJ51_13885 [Calothrix sp. MO_167.B12]|nr:hypothetical protein [Calothrix sp. MO_167.B12]
MTNHCSSGETGEVSVNGASVGSWDAPITLEISPRKYWDYIFTCIGANNGCITGYSVIYRESVSVEPQWAVNFWAYSGQPGGGFGSCNLPINNLRAKVSFDGGQNYKLFQYVNGAFRTIPDSSNESKFYPNGNSTIDLHGNDLQDAYPDLLSKTEITKYQLKIFSNNNQVFQQEYNSEPTVLVSCSGVPHDCLNGACVLASEFNTPGLYKSLSECQKVCGAKGCSGECLSKKEFSILKELARQSRNVNCS